MSNTVKHWVPHVYQSGDEAAILSLFETVFGLRRTLEHWRWKFERNLLGRSPIMLGVDRVDPTHVVGQYTVVPTPILFGGKKRMGAQSLDTMTHPSYQKQGMFVNLAEACYTAAADMGIDLVYGFPNRNSYHGLVASLGFLDLGPIPCYRAIASSRVIYRRFSALKNFGRVFGALHRVIDVLCMDKGLDLPAGFAIEALQRFDGRFDALWEKVAPNLEAAVWRDAAYLNWRFAERPDERYSIHAVGTQTEVLGFVVLAVQGDTGYVVDLLSVDPSVTRSLLQFSLRHLRKQGVTRVLAYLQAPTSEVDIYQGLGFQPVPSELVMVVKPLANRLAPDTLAPASRWYVTFGDTDGI